MRIKKTLVPFIAAAALATALGGNAFAEVGKKISVIAGGSSGTIAAFPTLTDYLSVAVPTAYKSKANFLKVTTTYQAGCSGGDFMGSEVDVGGVLMVSSALPFESFDEDAEQQIVSKTYYLVPEKLSGPAVPDGAMVTLKLTSTAGTGCSVNYGTMTVEALK